MIEVSGLTKMYGPRAAIEDLTFTVNRGDIVGFLGPNGAGKTTTMKILTGFMPATSGSVKIAGFDVFTQTQEVKKRVGFLPETPPLYLEMVVSDYLAFAAKLKHIPSEKIKSEVAHALEKVFLKDVQSRIIGNLSKGFRQRVGLAQALLGNPDLLILDEPTVGLDPAQIIEIRSLIKGLQGNHTVLLSTHILSEVAETCSHVIMIKSGKIVAKDSLKDLIERIGKGGFVSVAVQNLKRESLDKIRQVRGVVSIQESASNRFNIEIDPSAGEIRDQISNLIHQSGMGLLEFSSDRKSLEQIFLQLTA